MGQETVRKKGEREKRSGKRRGKTCGNKEKLGRRTKFNQLLLYTQYHTTCFIYA